MKKLIITALCLATVGYVAAQEAEAAPAGDAVGVDGGTAVVEAAQESAPAPAAKKFKNAKKVLDDLAADKGWSEGWDEEKGRIIVTADADFISQDPITDADFFRKREMAAKRAVLQGKAAIIEMINTQMSASEKFDMPGTDVHKQLGAEAAKVQAAMEQQKAVLASLLEKTDQAEADMLRGTTFGQRLDDAMAGAIKKLDKDYESDKHDAAAKARYEDLKAKYQAASKEFAVLKEKADKLQEAVQARQESAVTTMSRMPLYGSTVIMQTESWDDATGRYQVAVMITWSKALERAVRAIVTGENFKTKPGAKSVQQWLRGQELATMVGPRQYVDDKGNRWFLGVTARKYNDEMTSIIRMKNKGATEQYAKQMAAFCVFADVEAFKNAQQAMEVRGNEKETVDAVAESYAETLTQSFKQKTIRGLQKLASVETQHPITGDDIYVAVFGVNASSAAAALEAEKLNYTTKMMDNSHQTEERGRRAANGEAVRASENRSEDFQRGVDAQGNAIKNELKKRADENRPKGVRIYKENNGEPVAPKRPRKAKSGAFAGDDAQDDF